MATPSGLRRFWRRTFQPQFEIWASKRRAMARQQQFERRDKMIDSDAIAFLQSLHPLKAPPLELVGGENDGGYLVPSLDVAFGEPPHPLKVFSQGSAMSWTLNLLLPPRVTRSSCWMARWMGLLGNTLASASKKGTLGSAWVPSVLALG